MHVTLLEKLITIACIGKRIFVYKLVLGFEILWRVVSKFSTYVFTVSLWSGTMTGSASASLRVRKGAWTKEEDDLLRKCIEKYGEAKWHRVPARAGNSITDAHIRQFFGSFLNCAWDNLSPLFSLFFTVSGLNRCRKSCRLRWVNYLKPNIKRGEFTEDEVDLILRLHKLLGNRQVRYYTNIVMFLLCLHGCNLLTYQSLSRKLLIN